MPLTPGTTLGPYEVAAKIGEGGMGEVWKILARLTTAKPSASGDDNMANAYQGRSTMFLAMVLGILLVHAGARAQTGPNPYRQVGGLQAGGGPGRIGESWAELPGGREMGSPGGLEVDVDGEHLWAVVRCGNDGTPRGSQTYCDNSDLDPTIKFDPDGNVATMFGSRMFAWPHGLHVDRDGNVG